MSKLTGVKTLDMVNGEITKVAYGGAEYVKTESPVQEGDLFLLTEGHSVIGGDTGAFYLTVKDWDGDIVIPTKYVGLATTVQKKGDGIAFRKVSASQPTLEDRVSTNEKDIESLKSDVAALKGEAKTEYVRIDKSEAKAGDFVKFDEAPNEFLTAGKYYEIYRVDGCGDPQIRDDDGDGFDTYCADDFEVYRKVSAAEPKPERLKVGDYAKVVRNESGHYAEIDEIVLVKRDDKDFAPFHCEKLNGNEAGIFFEDELVRATDEEVAEAKRAAAERKKWAAIGREVGEYKVGDIVRVINSGFSKLIVGDIGPISEIDENCAQVSARNLTGANWVVFKRIELVTPVEARFDRKDDE